MFDLKPLERLFPHPIPPDYLGFMQRVQLPRLRYLSGEDLASLFGLDADNIIEANENLRDKGLNPHPWNDSYLAIGERPEDEAIYYLDLGNKTLPSRVLALLPPQTEGTLIAEDFTRWAITQLELLVKEDHRCAMWHSGSLRNWWESLFVNLQAWIRK